MVSAKNQYTCKVSESTTISCSLRAGSPAHFKPEPLWNKSLIQKHSGNAAWIKIFVSSRTFELEHVRCIIDAGRSSRGSSGPICVTPSLISANLVTCPAKDLFELRACSGRRDFNRVSFVFHAMSRLTSLSLEREKLLSELAVHHMQRPPTFRGRLEEGGWW